MFTQSKDAKLTAAKDGMLNEGGHIVDEAVKAAHHFSSDAHDAAAAVREDWEGVANRTGHHMRELADSAGNSLSSATQSMTVKIRENPIQSSLIALGLGLLVGRFALSR